MFVPFLVFWVVLFFAREDLGPKGIVIFIAIWLALLIACATLAVSPLIFVAIQSVIDVILIIVAFGGDLRIR